MRILLVTLCVLVLVAMAPAADARPPGGDCDVKEEYVTQAHTTGDIRDGSFGIEPGAPRPIECYY